MPSTKALWLTWHSAFQSIRGIDEFVKPPSKLLMQ
jgi:hypothetical protein